MNLFTACVGESCVIHVRHARRHMFNPNHQDKKSKRRTCTMSLDPTGALAFLIVDDRLLLSLSKECLQVSSEARVKGTRMRPDRPYSAFHQLSSRGSKATVHQSMNSCVPVF